VFALGFRLLPRFLVSSFGFGRWFRLGAGLEAVALVGFAVAYADTFVRSERRRPCSA